MSLVRIGAPVNWKLEFSGVNAGLISEHFAFGKARNRRGRSNSPVGTFLVLAEELLSVLNKADDYDYRGPGHAHEEQDLKDVHCEDSGLEHDIHCSCDWLGIPFLP